jgi:hypothetical protein
VNARRQYTDDDVEWISERVRYYIRKGFQAVYAIDRAKTDFQKRTQ